MIIAGDLNQLQDQDIVERTGLTQIVHQPTRGANILDRIFAPSSSLFNKVRVVSSVVKSDHKAVVEYTDSSTIYSFKTTTKRCYRRRSPSQHANFLQHVAAIDLCGMLSTAETQCEFDTFYAEACQLLNDFYPERTITITSRDPEYITPNLKAKLRRKNRLMRAGRVEEASSLSLSSNSERNCSKRKDALVQNWWKS